MEKYNLFKNINIENTTLIQPNTKDQVYNIMLKNNIKTLKDLFTLDDLNLIDYGNKKNYIRIYQTKGVIKLLRTLYLNEDLPYKDILDNKINNQEIIIDNKAYNIYEILLQLGLTFNASILIRDKYSKNAKLIDILKEVLENKNNLICYTKEENEKNLNRIMIIVDWYNKNKLNELNMLKQTILLLKELDKNIIEKDIELICNELNKKIMH